jgi:O-antigen ligase
VALLLALLAATLREGWRMARGAAPEAAACGVVLITVVVGMLVRNMTDVLLVRQNALLYWGVVGVLLAWGAGPRAAAR